MIDEILEDRMTNLLPKLMRKAGIDMWVIIGREYNEDPVMKTMLPAVWLSARRRTMMVFMDKGGAEGVERLAIARYDVGHLLKGEWDLNTNPDQWDALVSLIVKNNSKKIGMNFSKYYAHADGLTFTEHDEFFKKLPSQFKERVVSASDLAVNWLETRTDREMVIYQQICKISHEIIAEAFSDKVIQPGVTTTDDVVWWMRQKVTDLGLETWFHPTVDIQRKEEPLKSHIESFSKGEKSDVIMPGDLLHCDFGITYMGLNTDCQQHAYVPQKNETAVPAFLQDAFKKGNRVQDIFTGNFVQGKTGNEILAKSLSEAKQEGLRPSIYSHPLGTYGHSAGTTFGMWDAQEGVPVNGDYPLQYNTVYAIELNTTVNISEWGKDIRIMLEEDGFYGENGFRYVHGRQESIRLVEEGPLLK